MTDELNDADVPILGSPAPPSQPPENPADVHYRWVARQRALGISTWQDQVTGEELMGDFNMLSDNGKAVAMLLHNEL